MDQSVVSQSSETLSGAPVFYGTRVPVRTLIDSLKAGESIDEFLEGFPTVSREQVCAFLDLVPGNTQGNAQEVAD